MSIRVNIATVYTIIDYFKNCVLRSVSIFRQSKGYRIDTVSREPIRLRLPFTLSGVFSFSYVTSLIRIGHPLPIYQWKAYESFI